MRLRRSHGFQASIRARRAIGGVLGAPGIAVQAHLAVRDSLASRMSSGLYSLYCYLEVRVAHSLTFCKGPGEEDLLSPRSY